MRSSSGKPAEGFCAVGSVADLERIARPRYGVVVASIVGMTAAGACWRLLPLTGNTPKKQKKDKREKKIPHPEQNKRTSDGFATPWGQTHPPPHRIAGCSRRLSVGHIVVYEGLPPALLFYLILWRQGRAIRYIFGAVGKQFVLVKDQPCYETILPFWQINKLDVMSSIGQAYISLTCLP